MKEPQVAVVVEGGLMETSFRHILKNYFSNNALIFKPSLIECINGKLRPKYIIAESKLVPFPLAFSLGKIIAKNPDTAILLIETGAIDDSTKGYVKEILKRNDSEELINKKIKLFLNQPIQQNQFEEDDTISDREKEIVKLVALGKTNKEISDALFISPHTVVTHRKNITSKLGIKTIAGLTVYAILNGLINPED
jgi:DNA-binding CsgD family transcriptional regulator